MGNWDAHPPTAAFVNFYFLIPKLPVTRFHIHGGKYSKVNGILVRIQLCPKKGINPNNPLVVMRFFDRQTYKFFGRETWILRVCARV